MKVKYLRNILDNFEDNEEIEEALKWVVTTISFAAFNKEKELNKQWNNYRNNV